MKLKKGKKGARTQIQYTIRKPGKTQSKNNNPTEKW
jgi:hypothetical protein